MTVLNLVKKPILIVIVLLLVTFSGVFAQGEPATVLRAEETLGSSIDAQAPARVFIFVAQSGDVVNLVTRSGELSLGILLTNSQGTVLGQGRSSSAGAAALIRAVPIEQSGTFFVTVYDVSELQAGSFEILLAKGDLLEEELLAQLSTDTPTATEAPEVTEVAELTPEASPVAPVTRQGLQPSTQVLLGGGLEVRLSWNAPSDLNLEVRDPQANSLYWDVRTSPIGGTFGFDANGLCQIISENPVETASWAPGFLPSGSYEVMVFYRQPCETPLAVDFLVEVIANGVVVGEVNGRLSPPLANQNSVYLSSFFLDSEGQITVTQGGVYPDSSLNVLPALPADLIASALSVQVGTPVRGEIYADQPYLSYSYESQGNESISISLSRQSGSLDTLLQVMDPTGILLAVNDDAEQTRDSALPNLRLPLPGTYTIIATRYGKELGGTEGEFELLLSNPSVILPQELANLNLPGGDIEVILTWSTAADLQLLVRDPVGDAVFDDRLRVNSGGVMLLQGNLNCVRATTTPSVSYITWPTGLLRPGIYEVEVWYQNVCNDPSPADFTLTTLVDGQPVLVERRIPQPGQRYVISFTVNADRTASAGIGGFIDVNSSILRFNEQIGTATPIQPGLPVPGQLDQNNVYDLYTFEGRAGQVVSISMLATSQTLDTKLFLISPSGLEIADNDDADPAVRPANARATDALINAVTLPEDGTYLIIATRFATIYGGTVGGYLLTLQGS